MDAVVLCRRAGGRHCATHARVVRTHPSLVTGEDLPAAPHQKRSIDKRAKLKAAGLALFGEKGYEATGINDITNRANLAVGGFYQHFRSKRQLLLALMDELLEKLSQVSLEAAASGDARAILRKLLTAAFSRDLEYLGAYRAWREAVLSDPDLARKEAAIQEWTTARITTLFQTLQQLPGARPDVDIRGLARAMDSFFWNLLAQAVRMPRVELDEWIETSTHLIYHALFLDTAQKQAPYQ